MTEIESDAFLYQRNDTPGVFVRLFLILFVKSESFTPIFLHNLHPSLRFLILSRAAIWASGSHAQL